MQDLVLVFYTGALGFLEAVTYIVFASILSKIDANTMYVTQSSVI